VPNIKDAQKLDFAAFLKAFDELVAKTRKGAISPDDFMGTTVSLTNPGVVGTTSSAPRLMPGQGVIVATGALDYPAEYRSMAPRTLSLLGISTPVFWLGMMLILLFAVSLGWFPISGYGDGAFGHLVLPALTLGALQAGYIARMTRSALLEVLRQEYVRTARAKGLKERVVILKHGLRNGILPILTLVGIGLGDLLVGAPLTETVFAWPGLGRLLVAAVGNRDLPVVLGATLLFALIFLAANLIVDLVYALVDPRVRLTE